MESALARRLVAEAIGTALLVLVGTGSVVAALTVGAGAISFAALGFVSLAFAFVVAVVVYGFGPVSGAHINPAVTVALAVCGRFPWRQVLPYLLAQVFGAVVGSLLVVGVFGTSGVDLGLGSTALGEGVPYWQGAVAEFVGTFLLMFTVMALAVDTRAPLGWAGLMIGLAVAAAIMLIAPQTGGSLNPARTTGPDVVLALWGGSVHWAQLPLYWVAPALGAVAAALLYDVVAEPRAAEKPAAEEAYEPSHATERKQS
jgi:glycerol uptake facilitator protein